MAKDKQAKKISIKDELENYKAVSPVEDKKKISESNMPLATHKFDEEFNNKLIAYNERVTTLDEEFTKLKPFNKVMVRVFVNTLDTDSEGLLQPNVQLVPVPTRSGIGNVVEVENPFPYSRKAVVVAVPDGYANALTVGEVITLAHNQVKPKPVGSGDAFMINIDGAFIHPDFDDMNGFPPKDPDHKTYGYLLVDMFQLEVKL